MTLRRRILYSLVLSTLIPLMGVITVSYLSISYILENRYLQTIQNHTEQIRLVMANAMQNLNYVSQQLAYGEITGEQIASFLDTREPYMRYSLQNEINEQFNMISLTNPDIGFKTYFFKDTGEYLFNNLRLKTTSSIEKLPTLADLYKISYHSPHETLIQGSEQIVVSAVREVEIPGRDQVFVYVESRFYLIEQLRDLSETLNLKSIMTNTDNRIIYSELEESFPMGYLFLSEGVKARHSKMSFSNGFFCFTAVGKQGWKVISVISKDDFNREKYTWLYLAGLTLVLALMLSFIIGRILWRMVYSPLQNFEKEIELVSQNKLEGPVHSINIPEIDSVLRQFQLMKNEIQKLIMDTKEKEKARTVLEMEKLRSQINPHFLLNTLNTLHWMALINNQQDMDHIILSLNRLLSYNLGKSDNVATLKDELNTLKDYMDIQKIRHVFTYNIDCSLCDKEQKIEVPPFILQPLVENAIYHAFDGERGRIDIKVYRDDKLIIRISDNGVGMGRDINRSLWEERDSRGTKMGIGLNYVFSILDQYYGKDASVSVENHEGKGTWVILKIPFGMDR